MIQDNPFDGERISRQAAITTLDNPNASNDYLCRQKNEIGAYSGVTVKLCYVPAKLIISAAAFGEYLHNLPIIPDIPLELIAHTILDDLNNELVPKWIQITLTSNDHGLDRGHKILIEDRAPNWKNPELLNRLAPF